MPKITVIIPVHNRFEIADKSIESVYNQTYYDFELIVIDDCSNTEFSHSEWGLKWVMKFADHPGDFYILRNEVNSGSGLSRQRGLEMAKGEFVAFLDSDDFWTIDFLLECLTLHNKHPEINATYVTSYYTTGELRNKTDEEFTSICETLIKEYRVWQTGSLLWKRKYVAHWDSLSSNQDSLFEFNSGLINDKVKLCRGPKLYINKNTGYHTFDRVKIGDNIINQIVLFHHYSDCIEKLNVSKNNMLFLKCVCNLSILRRLLYFEKQRIEFNQVYWNSIGKHCKSNLIMWLMITYHNKYKLVRLVSSFLIEWNKFCLKIASRVT
jgi:glycosyltransferase involved in cell wall biosynthesis